MKILFHYPAKSFPKIFSHQNEAYKMSSKREKNEARKAKKKGGEKAKSKSQDCCVTFKPKNVLEILLSVHAQTSQANILHLDQKAAKCMTCKQLGGKF